LALALVRDHRGQRAPTIDEGDCLIYSTGSRYADLAQNLLDDQLQQCMYRPPHRHENGTSPGRPPLARVKSAMARRRTAEHGRRPARWRLKDQHTIMARPIWHTGTLDQPPLGSPAHQIHKLLAV
jgi:hypothetical protein